MSFSNSSLASTLSTEGIAGAIEALIEPNHDDEYGLAEGSSITAAPAPASNTVVVDASTLAALQEQNQALRDAMAANELDANSVVVDATQLQALQAQNAELKAALTSAQIAPGSVVLAATEVDTLQVQNERLKTQFQTLEGQAKELQGTALNWQQLAQQHAGQNQTLQQAVQILQEREVQYQQELTSANQAITQLQEQLNSIASASGQGSSYANEYEEHEEHDEHEEEGDDD